MGDLSQITFPHQETLTLAVPPHWEDHHFLGQPVLPAVEAMAAMARRVHEINPEQQVCVLDQVRFAKFLNIDPALKPIHVRCDLSLSDKTGLRAALVTRTRSKSGTISRSIEHASMVFNAQPEPIRPWPIDLAATLAGQCTWIHPDILYKELVPFGPAFQSICSPLAISEEGTLALVRAPDLPGISTETSLGSPFPLDGAFHAACVWSQRHAGIVAFPVGIEKRTILVPTQTGETYFAKILPVQTIGPALQFDIQIRDGAGRLREAARGVEMRDVSRGRWQPPVWIAQNPTETIGDPWPELCEGSVILERSQVADFAHLALSQNETLRMAGMGARRRNSYLSARMACKRLWRKLAPSDDQTPAVAIETVCADRPHPMIPAVAGRHHFYCSVSHDDRFCVAVADSLPLGVDVAKITSRAYRCRRLFMTPSELSLRLPGTISEREAALRIWSVKEAASKALNLNLADAWEQIQVTALEEHCSHVKQYNGAVAKASHLVSEGHLFTLIKGLADIPHQ